MRRLPCLLVSALLLLPSIAGAASVPITACELTIGGADTGVLQSDLDCSSSTTFGVRLLHGATLDLNGHTITGGAGTFATVLGVKQSSGGLRLGRNPGPAIGSGPGELTIQGPGGIAGAAPGAPGNIPACVLINGGHARIAGGAGRVDIAGCAVGVLGSSSAISNKGSLELSQVDVHDDANGVVVKNLDAADTTVHDTHAGIAVSVKGIATVSNVTVNDNTGNALFAGRRLTGSGVVTTGNSNSGVGSFNLVDLSNVTSTGNGAFGAQGKLVRLTDSVLTGNGGGDISSFRRPELTNVTCGTSVKRNGSTWGVCAND